MTKSNFLPGQDVTALEETSEENQFAPYLTFFYKAKYLLIPFFIQVCAIMMIRRAGTVEASK